MLITFDVECGIFFGNIYNVWMYVELWNLTGFSFTSITVVWEKFVLENIHLLCHTYGHPNIKILILNSCD